MRELIDTLKARAKKIPWLYEWVRRRRSRRQEAEYLLLREKYYRQCGQLFADPGWQTRSAELLRKRWKGPHTTKVRPKDIRIFVAAGDDTGGPRMLRAFERGFDTVICDLRQYRRMGSAGESKRSIRRIDEWRPRMQREVLSAFQEAHAERPVDLAFLYGSHLDFEPGTPREISSTGIPVAVLCLDDKHIFLEKPYYGYPNGQKPLIGSVDIHLTNSIDVLRWYMAEGVPAFFMPQGVDPEIFKPLPVLRDIDVSFIGQRYGVRARIVDFLRAAGIRVSCFGAGWGTRMISDAQKVQIYNRSRIVLGVGGTGLSERITCIKGRDFEVPACGTLYLTTYNPELVPLFDIGKEILCYYSEIDCVEIIRYYLECPEEAEAIGKAGHERCLREHTWEKRIVDLLAWMGILRMQSAPVPS